MPSLEIPIVINQGVHYVEKPGKPEIFIELLLLVLEIFEYDMTKLLNIIIES